MMLFSILAILFLLASLYNLVSGDYKNMAGTLVLAVVFFAVYLARRRRANTDLGLMAHQSDGRPCCCKCGSDQQVKLRAYLLTYSVLILTSKSPGAFKPICDSCSIKMSLPYTLGTLLLGWWGFPWGPIYTVQAVVRNFRGGVVIQSPDAPVKAQPTG